MKLIHAGAKKFIDSTKPGCCANEVYVHVCDWKAKMFIHGKIL